MSAEMKVDTSELSRSMKRTLEEFPKEFKSFINQKAFFVSLKALQNTVSVDKKKIKEDATRNADRSVLIVGKRGRFLKRGGKVKLIWLIINKRRGRKGSPGLQGSAMAEEVARVTRARELSRSFLKSGWLPALRVLARLVPSARSYASKNLDAKVIGQDKGSAFPAKDSMNVMAMIENSAETKRGHNADRTRAMMEKALQDAINSETADTDQKLSERLQKKVDEISKGGSARTLIR